MIRSISRIGGAILLICALRQAESQQNEPISEAERSALVALYNSTNGPQWANRTGWLGSRGTECTWFGVQCTLNRGGPRRETVYELWLANNNLAGSLPPELDNLDLEFVWVDGNHLTGPLPKRTLERWEAGPLRLSGYSSQFSSQIEEIVIRRRAAILCYDSDVVLRHDGGVNKRTEKCRGAGRNAKPYCEIKVGRVNLDRLARFLETSGFFELDEKYQRQMTHGGTVEIEVLRSGQRKRVVNYGSYGPQHLWTIEHAIWGVVASAEWNSTRETRDCEFERREW
jgi:hypothetical protein